MSQTETSGDRIRGLRIDRLRVASSRLGELAFASGGAEFVGGAFVAYFTKNIELAALISASGLVHLPIGLVAYLVGNENSSSR